MAISLETKVVAARHQVSCEVGGEVVIMNMADELYYGLDPVGARVWQLIQRPRTVKELRDALITEFQVDTRPCEMDLIALLKEMAQRKLVQSDGPF
jgi:hypothetical protein